MFRISLCKHIESSWKKTVEGQEADYFENSLPELFWNKIMKGLIRVRHSWVKREISLPYCRVVFIGYFVHCALFFVYLNTAGVTQCLGQCRYSMRWSWYAQGHDKWNAGHNMQANTENLHSKVIPGLPYFWMWRHYLLAFQWNLLLWSSEENNVERVWSLVATYSLQRLVLWNRGKLLPHYTASQIGLRWTSYSQLWESEISENYSHSRKIVERTV